MKTVLFLVVAILLISCDINNQYERKSINENKVLKGIEDVPLDRIAPSAKPIASYSETVSDNVNNANKWRFAVNIFETKNTFSFFVKVKYKEIDETDAIGIPNFGIIPKVVIQKGTTPLSCIIGFLGKQGEFKPYKKVCIEKDQLKIITLNKYSVSVFKQEIDR